MAFQFSSVQFIDDLSHPSLHLLLSTATWPVAV